MYSVTLGKSFCLCRSAFPSVRGVWPHKTGRGRQDARRYPLLITCPAPGTVQGISRTAPKAQEAAMFPTSQIRKLKLRKASSPSSSRGKAGFSLRPDSEVNLSCHAEFASVLLPGSRNEMSLRFHVKPGEFHSGSDQCNRICAWAAASGRGLDSDSLELTEQSSWSCFQGLSLTLGGGRRH